MDARGAADEAAGGQDPRGVAREGTSGEAAQGADKVLQLARQLEEVLPSEVKSPGVWDWKSEGTGGRPIDLRF